MSKTKIMTMKDITETEMDDKDLLINASILVEKYEDEIEKYKIGYELHDTHIQKLNEVIIQKDNHKRELESEVNLLKSKLKNVQTIGKKSTQTFDNFIQNIGKGMTPERSERIKRENKEFFNKYAEYIK